MEGAQLDLRSLSPEQHRAVTSVQGPMLVVAGAGSGKTRVLTYRVAYLLSQGVPARSVLALTFTNKAARVMKERIAALVGRSALGLYMGTFHSIFLRILRAEAETLGFTPSFSVYDTTAARAMAKRVVADLNLDPKQYDAPKVLGRVSMAKNNLLLPAQYAESEQIRSQDERARRPMMAAIYQEYHRRMRLANAMDFDDILVYTFLLLFRNPEMLAKYRAQFRYVLVDEYQDTNEVQNRILHLLAAEHQNLCVVGDDAQSIYAFRGAKIQNILEFPHRYPSCARVTLATNYRSTQAIVEAANRLIAHNANQIPKQCVAMGQGGKPVRIKSLHNSGEEARHIAEYIQEIALREHVTYDHFAILYRTHAHSRELEMALRRRDIPYMVYKGLAFWQRKEVQDLMAYFKLCLNPKDSESLNRVINFPPRGIGDSTLAVLREAAKQQGVGLWELMESERAVGDLRPNARVAVGAFVRMMRDFHAQVNAMDAMALAEEVYRRSGLEAHYSADKSEEGEARIMNLGEVFNAIEQYVSEQVGNEEYQERVITLAEFVDQCTLASDTDVEEQQQEQKVVLATVHASKGLEFDYVCVVGLEEGGFPSRRALQETNGVEEERRLCYVAVTRAAKRLLLTCVRERMLQGRSELFRPSRFLQELDPSFRGAEDPGAQRYAELLRDAADAKERPNAEAWPSARRPRRLVPLSEASQRDGAAGTDPSSLAVGCRVQHGTYGAGTVRCIMDEGMAARAVIQFDTVRGEKTLMLRFVQLEVL